MTINTPTETEVLADLDAVLSKLQALDATKLDSAKLVPLVKAVQAISAFTSALDAQIQERAVGNGEMIPGAMVKPIVAHRKWQDEETAAALAQDQFGDKAFERKLLSPAQFEKRFGELGQAFVAVASFKPDAGKRAVY